MIRDGIECALEASTNVVAKTTPEVSDIGKTIANTVADIGNSASDSISDVGADASNSTSDILEEVSNTSEELGLG